MTKRFSLKKLIRDLIPEIFQKANISLNYHIMSDEQYLKKLKEKLQEETLEVIEASSKEELIEEMGDLLEVIYALAKLQDIELNEVEKVRLQKKKVNGAFENRLYAESIELESSHPHVSYYEAKAHKYPEIE
jgi:predicted house-cleaning noncanonical NTP pyrophosphatase (MazG superfamily)